MGRTNSFDSPWRWTLGTGLQTFGASPAGFTLDGATGASADGSVIVGSMNDGVTGYAWRWTQSGGVQRVVGVLGGATFGPHISADGSTIVGTAEGLSISQAVRWTQATGTVPIGPITGLPLFNGNSVISNAVSADGSVIVGSGNAIYSTNPIQTTLVPFRWAQGSGAVGLLNNGQFIALPSGATATDVSADGNTIAIQGSGVWRWSAQSGLELLVDGFTASGLAPRISGDGQTVTDGGGMWQAGAGRRTLPIILAEAGCNFTGWNNLLVTDVSFNGRTLCGYGTNPTGQTEAWYATIPSPAAAPLSALGGLLLLRRRR